MYKTHKPSKMQWLKDHSFELTAGAIFTAAFAALVVISVQGQEAMIEEQKKQDEWYKQQLENGYTVVEQGDHLVSMQIKSIY